MNIEELTSVIEAAGGGANALEYADALLAKIHRIEATGRYRALLEQLRSAQGNQCVPLQSPGSLL